MAENVFNSVGQKIFNHLQSQNTAENLGFAGASFYVMMTIIKIWLTGNSKKQLIHFLSDSGSADSMRGLERIYLHLKDYAKLFSVDDSHSVLFHSCDISREYKTFSKVYNIFSERINFTDDIEAQKIMNVWVEHRTNGSISNVFSRFNPKCSMVLLNIFMAHPIWGQPFDAEKTKLEDFYVDGAKLRVRMMNQLARYPMIIERFAKFIFIPINRDKQRAVIVLPQASYSLDDVLQQFKMTHLPAYYERSTIHYIDLKLPKFNLFSSKDISNTLKYFNVTYLFESHNDEFRDIAGPNGYIKKVIQVVKVVIDESDDHGIRKTDLITNMDAITSDFHVDKPFLFLIYDFRRRIVLLSAAITNPNSIY
ncbi:Serpin I2 [Thelohanellus kitauei]|uniref:Serpin I2 n=1 Tax=Thelohanellus kitauei TaxID=669202 RepID=A0A0C2MJ41_THEKT|nr:Serpin I2 [Thelohanellus kitauei]